jgi:hypothetical protein
MLNCAINPLLLRQFWSLVEMTQASLLLNLDDPALIQQLTKELETQQSLDSTQRSAVNQYIRTKLPLIRDMARSRHAFV